MKKTWLLFAVFALLGYAFFSSPPFQTIAAGVAIFLFGMLFLEEGFQAFVGGVMEKVLQKVTNTVSKSLLFGMGATSVMQSSSLVTVIAISILSAGLITLTAGIGIIFGANLGTTTGAWLMAGFGLKVNLSTYAMPMIVFGLILMFQKQKNFKGFGNILAGIGFVFLGIDYMKGGFETFSSTLDLSQYSMTGIGGLLVFTLVGIVATVVMQSSHATLMLTIAALATGQVTYENALALSIGSNVGTTVTGILGALSANVAGRRLAMAHLIFNIVTGLLAIVLIVPLKMGVATIADGIGIASDNWTLRLATFHTMFNVIGVAVMLPFMRPLVRFLETRVKEKPVPQEQGVALEPLYLNESALAFPDGAIGVLNKEASHLGANLNEIITHGLNLHRHDIHSERDLAEVVDQSNDVLEIDVMNKYYGGVKQLYNAIIDFATRALVAGNMNAKQTTQVQHVRLACHGAAEIIKVIAELRENVNRYRNHQNEHIRKQYNLIRQNLAEILRMLLRMRQSDGEVGISDGLAVLREDLEKQDILANGTLDQLVRDDAIDSQMATSLMNDSAFAHDIGMRLIEITEDIYIAEGVEVKKPEEELASV
jgi:phosphate:Na+ symporter